MLLRFCALLPIALFSILLNAQINIQWESRMNGAGNYVDKAVDLELDSFGNTYVTGTSFSGASFDLVTVKYNADGDEVWRSSYGGSGVDEAHALTLDSNNDVIVTGSRFISGSDWDIVTIKYDGATGVELWSVIHAGTANFDFSSDIAVDASDNVVVVGSLEVGGGNVDFLTLKYSAAGAVLWSDSFGGSGSDDAKLVEVDAAGNVYVGGLHEYAVGANYFDFRLVKYNAGGVVQWSVTEDSGFGNLDSPNAMTLDAAGDIIMAGQGFTTIVDEEDYLTMKFDNATGALLWRAFYAGDSHGLDAINAVATDGANNVYVTGRSKSVETSSDFYTIAYSPAGVELWSDSYSTTGLKFDEGTDIRVADSDLSVYVTGYSYYAATNNDYTTIKYNAADGAIQWVTVFDGPSSNSDQALKMKLDPTENIFITGNSHGGSTNLDYSTIKYCQLETVGSPDTSVCIGGSVVLSAAGGDNITWAVVSGDMASMSCTLCESMTATPSETTIYTVSSESLSGCVDYDTIEVVVNPLPSPTIYHDTPLDFCTGSSVVLYTDDYYSSYDWSTGSTTVSTEVELEGTVNLTVVDTNGCINSVSEEIVVYALPVVEAGDDQSICPEGTAELSASGATSYLWDSNPSLSVLVISSPMATPTVDTEYFVTGTDDNGCINRDSVTVSVLSLPTVSAGPDASICVGQSVELSASGATSYSWGANPTLSAFDIPNPEASPTVLTEYFVTGTDDNGCSNIDSVIVSTVSLPSISAGADTSVCAGGAVQLFASGGLPSLYVWDADPTLSATDVFNPFASPSINTSYTVTGTDVNGCSNTASVLVVVNELPPVNAGADESICIGDSVHLEALGAITYAWTFDPTLSDLTISDPWASPITTRTYEVTGTDVNGCENSDEVMVTVNEFPTISAGEDITICAGDSTQLTATGGVVYVWGTEPTLSNTLIADPWAKPSVTTTYTVVGTSGASCSNSAEVTVTVSPIPDAPILTRDGEFIVSSYEDGNQWYLDETELDGETEDRVNFITIGLNGEYWVVYTDEIGCSVTSSRIVVGDIGVEENSVFDLVIYPNPSNAIVNIETKEKLDRIIVRDLQGKIVLEVLAEDKNVNQIDLTNLPSSIYSLQLVKGDLSVVRRVIKY